MFALLTVAGLLALVYQETLRIDMFDERKKSLEAEITEFDPRINKTLQSLRRAVEPDPALDELVQVIKSSFAARLADWETEIASSNRVSIFHTPSVDDYLVKPFHYLVNPFHIYVPDNGVAYLEILVDRKPGAKQNLKDSLFEPSQRFHVQLPVGISKFSLMPDPHPMVTLGATVTTQFMAPMRIEFALDDRIFHEIVCGSKAGDISPPKSNFSGLQHDFSEQESSFVLVEIAARGQDMGANSARQGTNKAYDTLKCRIVIDQD